MLDSIYVFNARFSEDMTHSHRSVPYHLDYSTTVVHS